MTKRDAVLGPYKEALLEGYFDNPDREAIEELKQYQLGQDGQPYHSASKNKSDPAGAGTAHGDRVIAAGLAVLGMREQARVPVPIPQPSFNSWERIEAEILAEREKKDDWVTVEVG